MNMKSGRRRECQVLIKRQSDMKMLVFYFRLGKEPFQFNFYQTASYGFLSGIDIH